MQISWEEDEWKVVVLYAVMEIRFHFFDTPQGCASGPQSFSPFIGSDKRNLLHLMQNSYYSETLALIPQKLWRLIFSEVSAESECDPYFFVLRLEGNFSHILQYCAVITVY